MHPDPGLVFPAPPDVLRQRMMVAEFVARQQTGSPVNGETPNSNHNTSNMPSSYGIPSPNAYNIHDTSQHNGMLIGSGPMSPNSQDGFPPGYDIAAHIKRKELFTQRKQREFIPDNKKDDSYWDRRRRNNEAAKRSREKRRFNDMVLEQRVVELTKENHVLKAQLEAIKDKYDICGENLVSVEQIMATLPTTEQVLSITKRVKLSNSIPPTIIYPQSPSPVPTSVIHQPVSMESPPPLSHHNYHSRATSPNGNDNENTGSIGCFRDTETYPALHHYNGLHQSVNVNGNSLNGGSGNCNGNVNGGNGTSNGIGIGNCNSVSSNNGTNGTIGTSPDQSYDHISNGTGSTFNGDTVGLSNVLNLSRRAPSPYEVSSGTGSGAASGDDEHDQMQSIDINNSLPLKLRHKSHLGDKDAATALLALQHIKQEPISRLSPPWDGEGSSDERDSGISIGTAEWTTQIPRKIVLPIPITSAEKEENIHLKSQIARLESEVASIKNMMILNTTAGGQVTGVNGVNGTTVTNAQ